MSIWRRLRRLLRPTPAHPRVPTMLSTEGPFNRGDLLVMTHADGTPVPPGWTHSPQDGLVYRFVSRRHERRPDPRPDVAFRNVRPITDEGTGVL